MAKMKYVYNLEKILYEEICAEKFITVFDILIGFFENFPEITKNLKICYFYTENFR